MATLGKPLATNKASAKAVARGTLLEQTIRRKLEQATGAERLEVLNESRMHNVPSDAETHFRVVVVSSRFEGATRLGRHRVVHRALEEELAGPIHALAIDALTPAEWQARDEQRSLSPDCRGGSRFDSPGD
ncbi:MAG: BolA family transcriptional regulator [Acidobacteriota bacterium]|nr:BolA family transcriptional regulator [Acidobacteriota bacterium]